MQRSSSLIILFLCLHFCPYAQKGDTVRKWLDSRFALTNKANMYYAAVAIHNNDYWYLFAVYPDTGILLKMYFIDRDLTIRDGPFVLYHPKSIKAVEGKFENNMLQGVWQNWYPNGILKDSGMLINNQRTGKWTSRYDNGQLMAIVNYPSAEVIRTKNIYRKVPRNKNSSLLDDIEPIGTKEGKWMSFYRSAEGQLIDSGNYNKNLKQGYWKSWYENGQLESVGQFQNDSLIGEWQFFRENGTRSTREKYVHNRVASLECFDEQGYLTGISCSVMKPPVPQGNFYDFRQYALDNMFWPKELKDKNIQGIVKVKYTITKEGRMTNFTVLQSPHELLSKEVERFFNTIQRWSPAVSHNRIIEFIQEFEVPFFK